jgi:hypothetical protein
MTLCLWRTERASLNKFRGRSVGKYLPHGGASGAFFSLKEARFENNLFTPQRICHCACMVEIPEELPTRPIGLPCPFCGAKPNRDCLTASGGFAAVHVARIKAAAFMNVVRKRKQNAALKALDY